MIAGDEERNRLCPPNPYLSTPVGWVTGMLIGQRARLAWRDHPELLAWLQVSRLEITRGSEAHADDPAMRTAVGRFLTNLEPALVNMERLCRVPAGTAGTAGTAG